MADVTATFAAKDQGVAAMIQRLENTLAGFQTRMGAVSASAKRMQGAFSSLGRSVVGLAAAYVGVTQAINAFNKAMDFGGRMNDLSEITGESAGNLAVLERAFDNTGVGGEKMMPMIGKMTEFIQNLEKGQEGAVATANKLGITFADLKNKTPIERFQMLLRAVAGLTGENDRLNASQDIFGTRMGGRLIPLIKNFGTEMQAASKQLGSVVEILNRNSAGIDEFGDRVQKAIAAKPMEFMIGLLDQMTGRTGNLVKAISQLDAAAAGQNFAKMFSGAMQEPGTAFLAMGEKLLLYIKKGGNALVQAALFAGEVYRKSFTDPAVFSRIASGFGNALGLWANQFNRILASGIKAILQPLTLLERIFGRGVISEAIAQIERLQAGFDASAESMGKALSDALAGGADRMSEIARDTARPTYKLFDEADQKAQADAAVDRLRQLGTSSAAPTTPSTGRNDEASTQSAGAKLAEARSKLVEQYNEEVERLRQQELSAEKFKAAMDKLNAQYDAVVRKIEQINAANTSGAGGATMPATVAAPPTNQMTQAALPEQTRQAVASELNSRGITAEKTMDAATETTLQKVASFLEQLNGKLPQPVLA